MSNNEQTLSIIKPDAVERNLENQIKEIFIKNGFNIIKEKKIQLDKIDAEKFYKVHETKPFYNDLCTYLSSGPIVVMVLEKKNAILANRELMGSTNPKDAAEGTIRKKFGLSIYDQKDLFYFLDDNLFNSLQLPYNPFSYEILNYCKKKYTTSINFQIRSIFLQGILLKKKLPNSIKNTNLVTAHNNWLKFLSKYSYKSLNYCIIF